jgi:hypothetical protein
MYHPLWREDGSVIYNCCWSSPAQSFSGPSPADSRPQYTVSDSRLPQPGGPLPRIYIPQEQGSPVIPPGTGFPFRRLLRLAGLRCMYSTPPPHGIGRTVFPWTAYYDTDRIESIASNSSVVACVFVVTVICLTKRCLATLVSDTDTQQGDLKSLSFCPRKYGKWGNNQDLNIARGMNVPLYCFAMCRSPVQGMLSNI